MFDSIQRSISGYTSKPMLYMGIAFFHFLLQLLVLFALLGVFFIIFLIASILHFSLDQTQFIVIGGILLLIFFYFSSGIKGAALNAYSLALRGERVGFFDFYTYSFKKAPYFFILFIVRSLIQLVPIAVVAGIYLFITKSWNLQYVDIFLLLLALFFVFIINYLFFGAFVSAAIYDSDFKTSLKNCFRFIKSTHIFSLLFYFLYAIIWITQFIPFINIVTFFVSFPILYNTMIIYFQKNLAGSYQTIQAKKSKPHKEHEKIEES